MLTKTEYCRECEKPELECTCHEDDQCIHTRYTYTCPFCGRESMTDPDECLLCQECGTGFIETPEDGSEFFDRLAETLRNRIEKGDT